MDDSARIYVVDVEAESRDSVAELCRSKGLEAKGFGSTDEFLAEYSPAMKGCIVIDIQTGGPVDLEVLERLKSPHGSLPIIVTTRDGVSLAVKAMQAGASSFLEKPYDDEGLWSAIEQALNREQTQYSHRRKLLETHERLASLTEDELEVFRRLLGGHANKRIAADLDVGLRTVELRRANIMRKMQATSLPDLVRLAILSGFWKADAPAIA
jgi:two-component system response regulator FixJ